LARPLQDRFSEFQINELLLALEDVCDQLAEHDQLVKIDKLEIDLGVIPIYNLEQSLKKGILSQFREQVQKHILTQTSWDDKQIAESADLRHLEALLYFFEFGTLPWWHSRSVINIAGLAEKVIANSSLKLHKEILPLLERKIPGQRIAETFSIFQLLDLIKIKDKREILQIWEELDLLASKGLIQLLAFTEFKRLGYLKILCGVRLDENRDLKVTRVKSAIMESLLQLMPELVDSLVVEKELKNISLPEKSQLMKVLLEMDDSEIKKKNRILKSTKKKAEESSQQKKDVTEDSKLNQYQIEETFIEVNNAGIVILWPYLEMFFKELNLIQDNDFIDDLTRWQAVHILHYLAFGKRDAEEHEYALNKILCGMKVSDFVSINMELSESTRKECEVLLQSVVYNWKALKNTSVKGFQEAFLHRNGLVKGDQNGYIIEVENKAIDILLNRMPWSIVLIKLPWLKELIHVKWEPQG